ncbi:TIGR00341 family protein [Oscillatoria sp. CS-180]|uniref:TIGR00341 family protein n=1 Tax=Oscillatoria sp. CS-180 TaxID=3021720 RepID=UPI00232C6550|nr:TIGR00341 family protein [Oscillatoria sp. CS-180]MDB9526609.1 TIGR00341 family protein [Oscillatoria sp. CS-180]
MIQRRQFLKFLARGRRRIRKIWLSNSGDWHWLASKPAPVASLNRLLWRESVPSLSFFIMLTLSGVISTLGLLAGSTATVIGAMIIAPLMGPIIGIAFAISVANRRLVKRAFLTVLFGTLATVLSATLISYLTGLRSLTEEIVLRTEPTLIDLVVAMAAGAAGAFSKSRKHIADAFPGVAISVALVPPLSAIGIGIALWNQTVWLGALLLFITNLGGIIFSGILIFIWQDYGSAKRAKGGLLISILFLATIGIPLAISLNNLLFQSNTRQQVRQIVIQELNLAQIGEIQAMSLEYQQQKIYVDVEILASTASIPEEDIRSLQKSLQRDLERPVELTVQIIPIKEFVFPASP